MEKISSNRAEIEINTIIKFILMGIGLVILLFIVYSVFNNNVSLGFESVFNLL